MNQPTINLMRELQLRDGRLPLDDPIITVQQATLRCGKPQIQGWSEEFVGLASGSPAAPSVSARDSMRFGSEPNHMLTESVWVSSVTNKTELPVGLARRIFATMCFGRAKPGVMMNEYITAMCIFTRGTNAEKIKFLFRLLSLSHGVLTRKQVGTYLSELVAQEERPDAPQGSESSWFSHNPPVNWSPVLDAIFSETQEVVKYVQFKEWAKTALFSDSVDLCEPVWKWSVGWIVESFKLPGGIPASTSTAEDEPESEADRIQAKLVKVNGAPKLSLADAQEMLTSYFPSSPLIVERIVSVFDVTTHYSFTIRSLFTHFIFTEQRRWLNRCEGTGVFACSVS